MTFCSSWIAALLLFWQAPGVAHIHVPAQVALGPGVAGTTVATISVDSGFHIQSDHPKLDYLIPSAITLDPGTAVTLTKAAWPVAKEYRFSFSDQPLTVFEGTFPVTLTLKAAGGAGMHTVSGRFRYQACNEQSCRPPVTQAFHFQVKIR